MSDIASEIWFNPMEAEKGLHRCIQITDQPSELWRKWGVKYVPATEITRLQERVAQLEVEPTEAMLAAAFNSVLDEDGWAIAPESVKSAWRESRIREWQAMRQAQESEMLGGE